MWNGGHGLNIQCSGFRVIGGSYISNSLKTPGTYCGIYVPLSSTRFTITDCTCAPIANFANSQRYGILAEGSPDSFRIINCDCSGNVSGNLSVPNSSKGKVSDCFGYNPIGAITPPPFPSNGTTITNVYNVRCEVFVSGGTITTFAKNLITIPGKTGGTTTLEPGESLTFYYTGSPTWYWNGF
ncbi:hypothetical protein D3C76_910060 [compost metagenome]